jgi:hypothetical protein
LNPQQNKEHSFTFAQDFLSNLDILKKANVITVKKLHNLLKFSANSKGQIELFWGETIKY